MTRRGQDDDDSPVKKQNDGRLSKNQTRRLKAKTQKPEDGPHAANGHAAEPAAKASQPAENEQQVRAGAGCRRRLWPRWQTTRPTRDVVPHAAAGGTAVSALLPLISYIRVHQLCANRRAVCRGGQDVDVTVEYVSAELPDVQELSGIGADFDEFKRIFERFTPAEKLTQPETAQVRVVSRDAGERCRPPVACASPPPAHVSFNCCAPPLLTARDVPLPSTLSLTVL